MKTGFYFTILFTLTIISACSHSKSKVSFVSMSMFNYIDSTPDRGKPWKAKGDHFIIKGYKDNSETLRSIDSFVNNNKGKMPDDNTQYDMIFYKESSITNIGHLTANPRDLDRYSQNNDMIYDYNWTNNGKLFTRYKYKNGKIIEPETSDIKIEDIPDSAKKEKH